MNNFRATLFFRASASGSKILNDKKYIFNTVNSGHTLFFRASASCSKMLNDENYFNTVRDFWATLFFKPIASCSKILNDKKFIFNTFNSGHSLVFRASASCSKILNDKKYIQYSRKFHGKLCFSGQCDKNFNTVYSASKGNYRKVSCQREHTTQGTSPPWVNKQGNYRICLWRHF